MSKLDDIYQGLRDYMAVSLGVNRTVLDHPGSKGDGAELRWTKFFEDHLPQRYQVSNGFVIDRHGDMSEQIDLIVYDRQYTPRLYNLNGQMFVPAESVYATLEVKQKVDKAMIGYAGEKAESVRKLDRTSKTVTHAGGTFAPRPPFRIAAGVLALESDWSPPFGTAFRNAIEGLPEGQRLDFGCAAARGGFAVTYGDSPPEITISSPEHSLVFLLFSMLRHLQALGTVPAMDYDEYLKTVTFE